MEHLCNGTTCWTCGEPGELREMRFSIWRAFHHVGGVGLSSSQYHGLASLAARAIRDDVIAMMTKIAELENELFLARRGPLTRVEIDPNVRVRGNQTSAALDKAEGVLAVGSWVQVFEPETDLVGDAWVTDIDQGQGLVYLNVAWSSLRSRREGE